MDSKYWVPALGILGMAVIALEAARRGNWLSGIQPIPPQPASDFTPLAFSEEEVEEAQLEERSLEGLTDRLEGGVTFTCPVADGDGDRCNHKNREVPIYHLKLLLTEDERKTLKKMQMPHLIKMADMLEVKMYKAQCQECSNWVLLSLPVAEFLEETGASPRPVTEETMKEDYNSVLSISLVGLPRDEMTKAMTYVASQDIVLHLWEEIKKKRSH